MRVFIAVFIVLIGYNVAAQDRVCLDPAVARFYLESVDELDIYITRDTVHQLMIENLRFQNSTKESLIHNLENSNKILTELHNTRKEQLALSEEEIKVLKKEVRKQKVKTTLVAIGSGVLILLILL
jgi:hypothetical protein